MLDDFPISRMEKVYYDKEKTYNFLNMYRSAGKEFNKIGKFITVPVVMQFKLIMFIVS
jgi:hypothetical protein